MPQQDAVARIHLDVAGALRQHARAFARHEAAIDPDQSAPARRQDVDVAAEIGMDTGVLQVEHGRVVVAPQHILLTAQVIDALARPPGAAAIGTIGIVGSATEHGQVARVGHGFALRILAREQSSDGFAAAQVAAFAHAARRRVLAPARLEFGKVDIAQEDTLLLGRQGREKLARIHAGRIEGQPGAIALSGAVAGFQPVDQVQLARQAVFALQIALGAAAAGLQSLVELALARRQEGGRARRVAAVAKFRAQPVGQAQAAAIHGHRLAGLVGQRLAWFDQVGGVEIAGGKGVVVGAVGPYPCHHRDAGAAAALA
ncbi:hypothetical protein D3C81_275700 [compost metagenome]